jgi:hypothetical protein
MDDVSKLGPLWVSQLRQEVAARRNRATESLMTVNPDGSYAEQHRMLIQSANVMLAAPELLTVANDFDEALTELGLHCECGQADCRTTRLRAAIAKATGSNS